MTLTVAVLGGGAIGNLFAVELDRQGHEVSLLSRRAEVIERVLAEGVTVHDRRRNRTPTSTTARVSAALPHEATGLFDVVVVTVKSADVEWAARLAADLVAADGLVISMQNGLRAAGIVEASIARGVAGTTYQGAVGDGPATVVWTLQGATLLAPRPATAQAVDELVGAINADGFPWTVAADRDIMLWEKLIVAISNSVSGALDLPVYDVLASPSARRLLRAGREEAVAVATALGVGIDGAAMMERLEAMGPDAVGATSGSTYQSLSTGRRPEVDDISGALMQLGHDLGIPTPVNEMLALMTEARCEVAGLSR